MNTPKPCDTCLHLYSDCMAEDDPSHMAECLKENALGDPNCRDHKKYKKEERGEN